MTDWTDAVEVPGRAIRKGDSIKLSHKPRTGWWKITRIEVSGDRCNIEVLQENGAAGHSRIFSADKIATDTPAHRAPSWKKTR